jgi:hypothetical protein
MCILFLSFGCNQNKIIEEEKFIKIYTDIIIANDTTSGISQLKDAVIKKVLSKYSVSLDDYKATIQYYNQDSERWEKFFAKALANLEEKRKVSVK